MNVRNVGSPGVDESTKFRGEFEVDHQYDCNAHVATIVINIEFLLEKGEERLRVSLVALGAYVVETDL